MTDLEVVNRALRLLGQASATSMADTAVNAVRAVTAYYLCRDEVLRMIPWPSCVHRALLKNMNNQACPWALSHRYEIGDRVTNDTAKTYQCITAGISAGAGGPTGTTSDITDGTVHWAYVEASTAINNWAARPLTAYVVGDLVSSDAGKVYVCITLGTTAAATPPTGTSSDITDGTAHWAYYGTPPHNMTVYGYQYVMPPDCLRILKLPNLAASKESDQGVQYQREGNWSYCDQDDSSIRYIKREEDPTRWDALLRAVVALRLATEIAFQITGKESQVKLLNDQLGQFLATARVVAMNEDSEGTPELERWEDA